MDTSVPRRAVQIYREDGLAELLSRSANYVTNKSERRVLEQSAVAMARPKLYAPALTEMCRAGGLFWQYGEPTTVDVDAPVHPGHEDNYTALMGTYRIERPWVCELHDARLLTKRGIAKSRRRWVMESIGTPPQFLHRGIREGFPTVVRDSVPFVDPETTESYRHAMSLVTRHNGSYGHWVLEDLPKLRGLREYEAATGNRPLVLIDDDAPTWMTDSLGLMGLNADRMRRYNGTYASVERLIIPSAKWTRGFHEGYTFAPEDRTWVRARLTDAVDTTADGSRSKIFVSRQGWRRHVSNFDEIEPILLDNGFFVVDPSSLSFAEQVQLFADAEIIMGVAGSGLHNSLFASEARLVEWKHPDANPGMTPWYLSSKELGHDHVVAYADALPADAHKQLWNRSVRIDPPEMQSVIDRFVHDTRT